jgi:hypothetical protein
VFEGASAVALRRLVGAPSIPAVTAGETRHFNFRSEPSTANVAAYGGGQTCSQPPAVPLIGRLSSIGSSRTAPHVDRARDCWILTLYS